MSAKKYLWINEKVVNFMWSSLFFLFIVTLSVSSIPVMLVFDMKQQRLDIDPDMKKILQDASKRERVGKTKVGRAAPRRETPVGSKKEKWKADSEAFRAAMRAGKQLKKAMDTGEASYFDIITIHDIILCGSIHVLIIFMSCLFLFQKGGPFQIMCHPV